MDCIYKIKSRFWIQGKNGTFLGEGRVQLLQAIEHAGSITAAAKELGLSYRKAWKMISIMNEEAPKPLVIREVGGSQGGGTRLTIEGRHAITTYLDFKRKCNAYIDKTFKEFEF